MNKTYLVKRNHLGDKEYLEGQTRNANESEVAHLVKNNVLEELNSTQLEQPKQIKPNSRTTKVKGNDQHNNSEATLSN